MFFRKEINPRKNGNPSFTVELRRGVASSLFIKTFSTILSLAVTISIARIIGAESFGTYSYFIALISVISILVQLGMPLLTVRVVSSCLMSSDWGKIKGIIYFAFRYVVIALIIVIIILVTILWFVKGKYGSETFFTFAWSVAILPLLALTTLTSSAMRGFKKVTVAQLTDVVIRPAMLLISIMILYFYCNQISLNSINIMVLHVVAAFFSLLIAFCVLLSIFPSNFKKVSAIIENKNWIRSVFPLILLSGVQVINNKADIIMIGIFSSSMEDVGVYRVASSGAQFVAFSLSALNYVMAPTFSQLYSSKEMVRLQKVVTSSVRLNLIFSLPAALLFIFFGEWILITIFGQEFSKGNISLVILTIGQLVNAISGSAGMLLAMSANEKDVALTLSFSALLNVVLNLILIPRYGINGAAVATTLTLVTWNLVLVLRVYKKLNISTTPFSISNTKC